MNQKNCNLLLFKSHMLVRNALNFHLSSLQFFFSPDIFFAVEKITPSGRWRPTSRYRSRMSVVSRDIKAPIHHANSQRCFLLGWFEFGFFFHTLSIVSGCKLNGLSTPNEKWLLKSRPSMKDVWFNFISPTPSDKINRTGVKLIT